jgi:site-specific recombinase XerC
MAGRRRGASRPDSQARSAEGDREAGPVLHQRRTFETGQGLPGSTFAQRRDAAILAVFQATGIRLSEMAGIRYYLDDPDRSDLDLETRQIKIRGKGGKERTVKID